MITADFLLKILGGLLIAFAVVFRPRLGSIRDVLDEADELSEEKAPNLFRLVRRTAEAIGAPMPRTIAITPEYNARAGSIGLTRRRILVLGLPMLAVLRPQERVALLGHELGHYINRDSRRGFSTNAPTGGAQGLRSPAAAMPAGCTGCAS